MNREIIFMHIPKNAGTSLNRIFKEKGIRSMGHNIRNPDYQSLQDYIKKDPKKKFIFTFVRNPWDRVVSTFFYLNKGGDNPFDEEDRIKYLEKYNGDFKLFIQEAFINKLIFKQLHFRPQYQWICGQNTNLLVDFIGYFENIQKDVDKLSDILLMDFGKIPHANPSKRKNYREYYNKETKEIIRNAYKKDIELFNYTF